jgi:hypothetical protein
MTKAYYAYIISPDGHVQKRISIDSENDEEAKRCAQQLVDRHAIELWLESQVHRSSTVAERYIVSTGYRRGIAGRWRDMHSHATLLACGDNGTHVLT